MLCCVPQERGAEVETPDQTLTVLAAAQWAELVLRTAARAPPGEARTGCGVILAGVRAGAAEGCFSPPLPSAMESMKSTYPQGRIENRASLAQCPVGPLRVQARGRPWLAWTAWPGGRTLEPWQTL